MTVSYTYEDYEKLQDDEITAYEYLSPDETHLFFAHQDPSQAEIRQAYRQQMANETMPLFNLVSSLVVLTVSVAVMLLWGGFFTAYEKIWFLSIMVLATIFSVIFPEESVNGVNGIIIMLLYLPEHTLRASDFKAVEIQLPGFRRRGNNGNRHLHRADVPIRHHGGNTVLLAAD